MTTQSNNPGAYFKLSFSGSSFTLLLNLTSQPSTPYMTIRWSVDDGAYVDLQIQADTTSAPIASSLLNGTHTLILYIVNSDTVSSRQTH